MATYTNVGNSHCNSCLNPMEVFDSVGGDAFPTPGKVSICSFCGQLSVFDDNLNLRAMTEEEEKEIKTYHPLEYRMLMSIKKLIEIKNKMK